MPKRILKIALLFGGSSGERDVSIASGSAIFRALRSRGHHVFPVDTQRGLLSPEEEEEFIAASIDCLPPSHETLALAKKTPTHLFTLPLFSEVDLVFLALHSGMGEDGTIQSMLDFLDLPYTGSGHAASAIAMDKDISKQLFLTANIPTPDWVMVPTSAHNVDGIEARFGFPVVVKGNYQGSSVSLSIVRKAEDLPAAIALARHYDREVMIEKFIPGRELTVGILDDQSLSVGEIIMDQGRAFDYESKYQGHTQEIFPADIPKEIERRAKELALKVHRTLKLRSYSRSDFRLDDQGNLWCLEVNTLPGMTNGSLLPQSAKACGISFPELCEKICALAIERKRNSQV